VHRDEGGSKLPHLQGPKAGPRHICLKDLVLFGTHASMEACGTDIDSKPLLFWAPGSACAFAL